MSRAPETCGDFGGRKGDGEPCGRAPGWGTDRNWGPCRDHPQPSPFEGVRHPIRRAFLKNLVSAAGNMRRAADLTKIDRTTPYTDQWKNDPEYAEALPVAKSLAADVLEGEAIRRAFEGVEKPVGFYKGVAGDYVKEYSDTLLLALLQAKKRREYSNRVEHAGDLPTPTHVHVYLPSNRRDELPGAVRKRIEAPSGNGTGSDDGE